MIVRVWPNSAVNKKDGQLVNRWQQRAVLDSWFPFQVASLLLDGYCANPGEFLSMTV